MVEAIHPGSPSCLRWLGRGGVARVAPWARQEWAMDHVIASAPEDIDAADRLAELLRGSGLPGKFECLTIEDETALEATLEQDRDGASTYVLLVSRDFASRVRSLAGLD